MEKIDKLEVGWSGLLPVISKRIGLWRPPKLKSEKEYRNDLLSFLREIVPEDCMVEKEYRHRGTTIDIWIGWKGIASNGELAIEIKHDLNKKAAFDRLVGQIEGLNPKKNKLLVVLIGATDPALAGRLKEKYAERINDIEPTVAIVHIGTEN